jgi:hypothetical protein
MWKPWSVPCCFGIAPPEGDDEPGDGVRPVRGDQQVDVVGHEGVSVQRAVFFLEGFSQPVKIGLVVFFTEEAGFAVMSTLHDVQGDAIKMDARAAGHGAIIAKLM